MGVDMIDVARCIPQSSPRTGRAFRCYKILPGRSKDLSEIRPDFAIGSPTGSATNQTGSGRAQDAPLDKFEA